MSDLDNEELIATRRLHGLDDNLFKKINTEDNIKRCEQLTKPEHANWIGISNQMAIAGVLARIKELEDDLYIADYTVENSIPIKKINDQIEKYKHMLALTTHGEIQKYTPGEIILKINTLEELLEEK